MRSKVVFAVMTLIALLYLGSSAHSAPQFQQYKGDARRTGRSNYVSTYSPTKAWSYDIGANCSGSPIVGQDGTVYFGAYNDQLFAIGSNGQLKWSYSTSDKITGTVAISNDGTIYMGTAGGMVQAINDNGTLKWQYRLPVTTYGIASAMMVHNNGGVYFGADDSYVYALNTNGTLKWKFKAGGAVKQGITSSLDGSVIYTTANDGCVYAINDVTGKQLWKSTAIGANGLCTVGDDGTIYTGSSDGSFYAFNPNGTSKCLYRAMQKISASSSVAKDGTIYFGSADSYLYAIDSTGKMKWRYRTNGVVYSSPLIDVLGNIILGTVDGSVVSLNPNTGVSNWLMDISSQAIYTSPSISYDGSIYVIDANHQLIKLSGPVPVVAPEPPIIISMFAGAALVMRKSSQKRRSAK